MSVLLDPDVLRARVSVSCFVFDGPNNHPLLPGSQLGTLLHTSRHHLPRYSSDSMQKIHGKWKRRPRFGHGGGKRGSGKAGILGKAVPSILTIPTQVTVSQSLFSLSHPHPRHILVLHSTDISLSNSYFHLSVYFICQCVALSASPSQSDKSRRSKPMACLAIESIWHTARQLILQQKLGKIAAPSHRPNPESYLGNLGSRGSL